MRYEKKKKRITETFLIDPALRRKCQVKYQKIGMTAANLTFGFSIFELIQWYSYLGYESILTRQINDLYKINTGENAHKIIPS